MKLGRILSLWVDVEQLTSRELRADLTRNNVLSAIMAEPWVIHAIGQLGGTATFQEVYEYMDKVSPDIGDIHLYLAVDSLLLKGKVVSGDGKRWYSENQPEDHTKMVLTTTGTERTESPVDAPDSVYRRLNIIRPLGRKK